MTTPAPKSGPGDMTSFNILHGFVESLVRGMRSSFLGDADYHHLTQCETLDDVRLNLSETDYSNALEDMNALIPTGLQKAAVEKVRRCRSGRGRSRGRDAGDAASFAALALRGTRSVRLHGMAKAGTGNRSIQACGNGRVQSISSAYWLMSVLLGGKQVGPVWRLRMISVQLRSTRQRGKC